MLLNKFIRAAGFLKSSSLAKRWGMVALVFSLGSIQSVQSAPAQYPLFLANSVTPVMMLTMDKDHQLYMKAYDDYSDIMDSFPSKDGNPNPNYGVSMQDGIADTTYVHKYKYYGYYDSKICYDYNVAAQYFEPKEHVDAEDYCSKKWSGNFLNWATMTRIDIVRKILYGGLRKTDTDTETVLERAFLPNDAHSFAKYYDGTDIPRLTPFAAADVPAGLKTKDSGITLCNTTAGSGFSQDNTNPPLIRVVKGNYSLWASSERWQCKWGTSGGEANNNRAPNGNDPLYSGIPAYDQAPPLDDTEKKKLSAPGTTTGEYVARVKVCVDKLITDDANCKTYNPKAIAPAVTTVKPIGLLQKYGEKQGMDDQSLIKFGLITGSYGRSKSGGVLRKNVSDDLSSEIDSSGKFTATTTAAADGRIINTLNKLRLYGYRFPYGDYHDDAKSDNCGFHLYSFSDGNDKSGCSNWGNPQSEIYYEALRYLAGTTATPEFSRNTAPANNPDSNYLKDLIQVEWSNPISNANYCAPLSILQFSGATSSYDVDLSAYTNTDNIGLTDLKTAIDDVGKAEGVDKVKRFVGKVKDTSSTDTKNYQLCTAKQVTNLSEVSGICPESPRLEGGYAMVGLARHARLNGIPLLGTKNPQKTNTVRTFGVALAAALPKVEVIVPGSDAKNPKTVIIQPACRNVSYRDKDKASTLNNQSPDNNKFPVTPMNCAIVDFKVVSQSKHKHHAANDLAVEGFPNHNSDGVMGVLYVSWEDSEQGGDYDQDMWGTITYLVTPTDVYIKTQVMQKSTSQSMGFGYILSGTNKDGFRVHSGVNYFQDGVLCTAKPSDGTSKISTSCSCTAAQTFHDPLTAQCDTKGIGAASVQSYIIQASDATFLKSPLYYASKWGGYDSKFAGTKTGDDLKTHIASRDPTDNSYFFAANPRALAEKLDRALVTIASDKGVASGVATNNNYLKEGTYIFRSEFNSFDWSGAVKAFAVDNNGDLVKNKVGIIEAAHSTTSAEKIPEPDKRTIYVNNNGAKLFRLENLTTDQQAFLKVPTGAAVEVADLATERIKWLHGSPAYEGLGKFRARTTDEFGVRQVLGDLVNSSPVYVGATDYHYDNLSEGGKTYRDYVKQKAEKVPKIYVGGNDGMVHAFNASNSSDILTEMYAFIPTGAFPKLSLLMNPDYGSPSKSHEYLVDGPITTGDVYIGGKWRTIIVGTLGAGGRGVYALEVMSQDQEVTDSKPRVLFELSEKTHPALGYVMGTPVIAPMANNRWAVVFGNGDTSSNDIGIRTSQLLVIDIEEPMNKEYSQTIDTKDGTGLSAPALHANALGQAAAAYAGDLAGNLWRFDLSNKDQTQWKKDYLVFKATETVVGDTISSVQPIFAAPTLGINSEKSNRIMVYFGTGKYYDVNDNNASERPRHSFYAIADIGKTVDRIDLYQKTYTGDKTSRTMIKGDPDWKTKHNGWYLDLGGAADPGERVTTSALLVEDKLIFPTLITSKHACDNGGTSWLMEVPAIGNKFIGSKALENNIRKSGLILGNIALGKSKEGARVLGSTTEAKVAPIDEKVNLNPGAIGRQSWRQVR